MCPSLVDADLKKKEERKQALTVILGVPREIQVCAWSQIPGKISLLGGVIPAPPFHGAHACSQETCAYGFTGKVSVS